MSVELLPANLQSTLRQIIDRSNASNGCIRAILLSTAEGVPLGRVYPNEGEPLNDDVLSSLESTWAPASKQLPLLNMGKEARTVTAIYDHGKKHGLLIVHSTCQLGSNHTSTYYLWQPGTLFHVYQAPIVSTNIIRV